MKKTLSVLVLGLFMAGCSAEPMTSMNEPVAEPMVEDVTVAEPTTDSFGEEAVVTEVAMAEPMHPSVMAPPVGAYKIGNTYNVDGETYTPVENYAYTSEGMASWYGSEFEGQKTANGEIFNPNLYTAAHKTLPLPSVVKVTNLENNKSVIVRVNDRGPFTKDRLIDVSEMAAVKLDFKTKGTARVKMEVLEKESLTLKEMAMAGTVTAAPAPIVPEPVVETPAPAPVVATGSFVVQAGAFNSMENATAMQTQLSNVGMSNVVEDAGYFKVRFGPFKTRAEADAMATKLRDAGISPGLIKDGKWMKW